MKETWRKGCNASVGSSTNSPLQLSWLCSLCFGATWTSSPSRAALWSAQCASSSATATKSSTQERVRTLLTGSPSTLVLSVESSPGPSCGGTLSESYCAIPFRSHSFLGGSGPSWLSTGSSSGASRLLCFCSLNSGDAMITQSTHWLRTVDTSQANALSSGFHLSLRLSSFGRSDSLLSPSIVRLQLLTITDQL